MLTLDRSPRGWLLHGRLNPAALRDDVAVGVLAPQLFELSDAVFGTSFGELTSPFGLGPISVLAARNSRPVTT